MNLDSRNSFAELNAKLEEVSSCRREILSIRQCLENEVNEAGVHTDLQTDEPPSAVALPAELGLDNPGGIYSVESDSEHTEPSPTYLLSTESGGFWYRDLLKRGTPK